LQENRKMLDLKDKQIITKVQVQAAIDNNEIQACYCSIFKNCWLAGRNIDTKRLPHAIKN